MAEVKPITKYCEWDSFVEKSPQGTVFSTTKWMNLFDEPYFIYGYYKGNNLMGGIAGFSHNQIITPFQGILVAPVEGKYTTIMSLHNEVADALIGVLPSEFTNHYTYPDMRPFLWKGFKVGIRYTYVVTGESEWDKQTKYDVTHCDVEIIESDDIDYFDKLYGITFERKGLKRTAPSHVIKRVYQKIPARMYMAEDKSSAVILIFDSKRAYYILGASDGSGTSSKCLAVALEGISECDLIGCNDKKIGAYKKGFGGKLMSYFNVRKLQIC